MIVYRVINIHPPHFRPFTPSIYFPPYKIGTNWWFLFKIIEKEIFTQFKIHSLTMGTKEAKKRIRGFNILLYTVLVNVITNILSVFQ